MRLYMLALLTAATWASAGQTSDHTVASVCKALADSPDDGRLLEMLKPLVQSEHADARSGRLAVLYALGLTYLGQDEVAARVHRHVVKSYPDSAYLKYLGDEYTSGDCPTCRGSGVIKSACRICGGTGHCDKCSGRGKIMMSSLGGSRRDARKAVACAKCRGTGQCPACKGNRHQGASCSRCDGHGRVPDHDRLRLVYLAILKGEDIPPPRAIPHGARAVEDIPSSAKESTPPGPQPPGDRARLNARWLAVRLVVPAQGAPATRVLTHADGTTERIPFPRIEVPEASPQDPDGVVGCIMQASQVTTGSGGIPSVWRKDVRGKKVIYGLSLAAHVPIFPHDKTGIQMATELGVRHQLIEFDFDDKATEAWAEDVLSFLETGGYLRPPSPYRLPGQAMAGSLPRELARFAKTGRKW